MRVISGLAKGRRLIPPNDRRIRPTSDRIKESIFSIIGSLQGDLTGFKALDIFAGTGSLGIEALSRGAAEALFIDNHRESTLLIRKNLEATGFTDRSKVWNMDASSAISKIVTLKRRFDLIFSDPPYGKGLAQQLLTQLGNNAVLNKDGIAVIETAMDEELPDASGSLRLFDHRVYGDTAITFYTSTE